MPEVWFYHLTGHSLERALPVLLERTLARGWRAVVEAADQERLEALDSLLWTYSDDAFLAHGRARDGDGEMQPVWLTCGPENPNRAEVRFFVGGAALRGSEAATGYERIILMFDGNDEEQVASARSQWRDLKNQGAAPSYWRQGADGRWQKAD